MKKIIIGLSFIVTTSVFANDYLSIINKSHNKYKEGVVTPIPTSCSDILVANPNSQNGNYDIKVNGKSINVYCDMETDGGGWTQITEYRDTVKVRPSIINIDTNDHVFTEVYLESVENELSYQKPTTDKFVDYQGIQISSMEIKSNDSWQRIINTDYEILEANDYCWYKYNLVDWCGNKVKISNVDNITNIYDTESRTATSYTDNWIKYSFNVYVR